MGVTYDSTEYIDVAVHEVYKTLAEAIVLVLLVIWLFLGSARAALIPAVTVPVCVIAAFMALWAFGFSINLLTLLALVLSIGLVVDDAIVVLENAQRRADLGEPAPLAALRGTRQVAFAVIATTAVLIAVFVPMAFQEGNNGRLFRELAVALASAVAISAFVALTLTPMMCSLLIRPHKREATGFGAWSDRRLKQLSDGYKRQLAKRVGRPWLFFGIMVAALVASGVLFSVVPRELAPTEDRGAFFVSVNGPEGGGYDYIGRADQEGRTGPAQARGQGQAGQDDQLARARQFRSGGGEMQNGQAIVILKPWSERASDHG